MVHAKPVVQVTRVNYGTGTAFLTAVHVPGEGDALAYTAVRFATDGQKTLADVWNVLDEAIKGMVKASFGHVKQCHCGW